MRRSRDQRRRPAGRGFGRGGGSSTSFGASSMHPMDVLERLSFNDVLRAHAAGAAVLGGAFVVLPHRLFGALFAPREAYSHVAHEIARCYGALTLAQAWLTWRTCAIADARVRRMLAESYTLAYAITALALARASLAAPRLHGLAGLCACFGSIALSALYAYFRFVRKLKGFELPGVASDADL